MWSKIMSSTCIYDNEKRDVKSNVYHTVNCYIKSSVYDNVKGYITSCEMFIRNQMWRGVKRLVDTIYKRKYVVLNFSYLQP